MERDEIAKQAGLAERSTDNLIRQLQLIGGRKGYEKTVDAIEAELAKRRSGCCDYTITILSPTNGEQTITIDGDYQAVKTEVDFEKHEDPAAQIFVTFYRSADGQRGYLNRDGNHDITGEAW